MFKKSLFFQRKGKTVCLSSEFSLKAIAGPSTGMNIGNVQLPQFNGKNYDYWAITMRALFVSQYLWEFVEDSFVEPTDE